MPDGKKQHSSKRTLLVVAFAGAILSLALVFGANREVPIVDTVASLFGQKEVNIGLPIRLLIPKISVDAAIEYVGVAPDGSMGVPKGPDGVAWFQLGPRPGEEGSAVLAGHFGWKNNLPAVFDDIHTLEKGDTLVVEDDTGATSTFVVREIRLYDPLADSEGVFGSSDGKAHLNLVTCEGVWDAATKSYSKRLVVFTDRK